ncbi:MAG: hypothetical protein NZ700_15255 [Gemmataceae bacterium]|nr:hypothetical protein [Gemmataceae bacterium]MDW8266181.1 hypothetical protein [Gemmataceae bacterium]
MPPIRSRYGTAAPKVQAKNDAYTAILAVSLVGMVTGCVLLFLDYSQYPDMKPPPVPSPSAKAPAPQQAPAPAPPAGGAPMPPAGGAPMPPAGGGAPMPPAGGAPAAPAGMPGGAEKK